jgi:hypothetical protein
MLPGASSFPDDAPPDRDPIIAPIHLRHDGQLDRLDATASMAAHDGPPLLGVARVARDDVADIVARQSRAGEHDPRWLKVFIALAAFIAIGYLWLQGQDEGVPATVESLSSPVAATATPASNLSSSGAGTSVTPEATATIDHPATRAVTGAGAPATATPAGARASPTATAPGATAVSPTATPVPGLVERVLDAESNLRSGRIEAVIDFGNGPRSIALLAFDLGGADTPPRLRSITTYQGTGAARVIEMIIVGEQSWRRVDNGPWTTATNQDSVWGNVRSFLPSAHALPGAASSDAGQQAVLTWHDANRDSDVTLEVDPATGTPVRLTQVARQSPTVFTVAYLDWNSPVEISPPEGG